MKIITLLKQVPDAEARIRAKEGVVDLEGVTFVIDGMDEYGVEEALRIREAGREVEIVALSLGPKRFEEAIRTALALGVDRAVHIETEEVVDPISQAQVLAKVIADEQADLVLLGGQQADWDSTALGPAVAEALGWPHSDWTTRLALTDGRISVTHDSDDGSEELELPLPAVVTTQQGLNDPRYPTLPNIMKSKRKELRTEPAPDTPAATRVLGRTVEQRERRRKIVEGDASEGARAIASLLREAGK